MEADSGQSDGGAVGIADSSLWIKAPQHILRVEGCIARRLQTCQSFWAWWRVVNTGVSLESAKDSLYLAGYRLRARLFAGASVACLCLSLFFLSASFVDRPGDALIWAVLVFVYAAAVAVGLHLSWHVASELGGLRDVIEVGIERENVLSIIAGNDERLHLIYDYMPAWLGYLTPRPRRIDSAVGLVLNNLAWYLDRPRDLLTVSHVLTSSTLFIGGATVLLATAILMGSVGQSWPASILAFGAAVTFASFSDVQVFRRRVISEEMLRYIAAIKLAGAHD